jgi:NAD(P)-dependent dehydrogenase (short-subunit alcohol dehydrogenase family)
MTDTAPVALVTGASGNLGRALCAALAASGVRLAALDRDEATLTALLDGLPGEHLALGGVDLTDEAACRDAVARIIATYGRLDAVAQTVGGFAMAPLAEAGPALFEQMFRINVLTTANVFRAAAAPMRDARQGSMVAVGAMAALKAPGGMHAYAAAKAGVLRLVDSFANELKPDGVRVNAVLPGTIDTPQNRAAMPGADTSLWVPPARLAAVIAFLLSDAAVAVTGAHIPVTARG